MTNPIPKCPPPGSPAPQHHSGVTLGNPKPQPSALCGFLVSVSPMVTRGPFLGCEGWMWLTLSPRCPPQVWDEANRRALELAEAEGWVSIHPFDHPLVW